MEQGLLHLYWGDGKGKTTAAMGLALRALGSGKTVVIVQFLKGGKSGEVPLLEQLGAKIYRGKAGQKFVFRMNDAEKAATRQLQNENLRAAMAQPADLLILDEAGSAWELDMVDKDLLQEAVLRRLSDASCPALPQSAREGAMITVDGFVGRGGHWCYWSTQAADCLPIAAILCWLGDFLAGAERRTLQSCPQAMELAAQWQAQLCSPFARPADAVPRPISRPAPRRTAPSAQNPHWQSILAVLATV